jgi:hypothetical protein
MSKPTLRGRGNLKPPTSNHNQAAYESDEPSQKDDSSEDFDKPKSKRISSNSIKMKPKVKPKPSWLASGKQLSNHDTSSSTLWLALWKYISGFFYWEMKIINMLLPLMSFLLALSLACIVIIWLLEFFVTGHGILTSAVGKFCVLPGLSYLGVYVGVCERPPPKPKTPLRFFQEGLDYGSKMAEMQMIGADSVELPYLLQISEGQVRGMIIQLSAVDLPSRYIPIPISL